MKRHRLLASALVLAATALAVTPLTTPPARAAVSGDYRIGGTQPVDSVNPFNELNEISYDVTTLGYDLLLNYRTSDAQPDLEHSLASAYTVSPDAKTWTFTLREGVVWSDGRPFTSADVKWTYDAVRTNTTNVMNAYLANVKSVDSPTATSVVLHLSAPDVRLSTIFVPIFPKHVFARYPVAKLDKIAWPIPSVTTAPYRITSWSKDGTTIMEPNARFRGTPPAAKRILITHYSNQDGVLRDLELGAIDMIVDGDARWAGQLAGNAQARVWSASAPGYLEIAFNSCPPGGAGNCSKLGPSVRAKVVQDPAIRKALAYGIDRETIAKVNYSGQSVAAYGLISPYYSTVYKDWSTDPQIGYRYDPAKAEQVLAAGGWDCSSSPCTKGGTAAQFTLSVRTNDPTGQNAMRRVVAYAQQIGIRIKLSIVTEDALNNKIYAPGRNDTYDPDFDAFFWAWTGDPTPDFDLSVLNTGSVWSDSYYSNKAYDALTAKALQTTDVATRTDLLHRAEKIAMTDLPYIPIVYSTTIDVTRTDTWHGYAPSPATKGSPIGTNWQQLTELRPGPEPARSGSSGAPARGVASPSDGGGLPVPAAVLVAIGAAVVGYLLGRRPQRRRAALDWTDE